MKPLIVLLISFLCIQVGNYFFKKDSQVEKSARIAMSIMFLFTSIGHFVFAEGMTLMIPSFVPYPKFVVFITGIMEIILAIALIIPSFTKMTGWLLILFLLCMLPANVYAAFLNINYQTGTLDGPGLKYLWFRIPLQCFFIFWIYRSAIKQEF